MRLRTVALATAALLVGAVVAVIAIIQSIDFNQYRGVIAEMAKDATGRDLAIAGDLGFALLPSPRLKVENVTFANAPGGSRPEMVKLRSLEAEVDLLPLLSGNISVRRIVMIAPDILLETDAQGRGNWEIVAENAAAAAADKTPEVTTTADGSTMQLTVHKVEIRDASFVYRDAKANTVQRFTLAKLIAKADSVDSPLRLEIEGVANDIAIVGNATLGAMAALEQGRPWPVAVDVKIADTAIKIDGIVAKPMDGKGYDLTATASGPEVAELARLAGVALQPMGPFKLSSKIVEKSDAPSLSDLKVEIGKPELVFARVEGSIANLTTPSGINLTVTVEGKDLAPLSALAGTSLAAFAPLNVSLRAVDGQGGYTLSDINVKAGPSDLAGTASIAMDGPRPRVKADLVSKLLDVDTVTGASKPGQAGGAAPGGPAAGAPPARNDGRMITDVPIPLELLQAADADITLKADRVNAGGLVLQAVAVDVALNDGNLRLKPAAQLAGGKLEGEVTAAAKTAQLAVKATVRSFGLGGLLNDMKVSDLLTGGKVDADIDISGPGRDLRAFAGGMKGNIGVALGEGKLATRYADFIAADLIKGLAPWGAGEQDTRLNCVITRFDVANGLVTARVLILDTARISVRGEGTINLANEKLDLTMTLRPKEASLLSLAIPVRVGGTMASPSFLPDPAAVAKGVAGAVVGTAINLLGALLPFISGGSGSGENPCVTVASTNPAQPGRPPAPTQQQLPPPQQPQVPNVLDGLQRLFR